MAEFPDREHFIPLRIPDLVRFLYEEQGPSGTQPLLTAEQRAEFGTFAHEVIGYYHAKYHDHFLKLKDAYAPFDPDRDTVPLREPGEVEREEMQAQLFELFDQLMTKANYVHLSREQIIETMEGASDWGIDMDVEWDVFNQLEMYIRSEGWGTRRKRNKWKMFRMEERRLRTFTRLALILRQQPHKRIGRDADVENVYLKLFKDIPKQDLEMTLPGTKMKMPKWEFRKLGASIVSTVGYLSYKLYGFILGVFTGAMFASPMMSWLGPTSLIATYGYKQWYSYQVTRQQYQAQLTRSLYFQTLDSNGGVLNRILEDAEDQEVREVLLPYFFLWRYASQDVWTERNLDDYIELELERRLNIELDFEIDDAMDKLKELGLVEEVPAPPWLIEANTIASETARDLRRARNEAEPEEDPRKVEKDRFVYRAVPLSRVIEIMHQRRGSGSHHNDSPPVVEVA